MRTQRAHEGFRGKWSLAKALEVFPGSDGHMRQGQIAIWRVYVTCNQCSSHLPCRGLRRLKKLRIRTTPLSGQRMFH